MPAKLLAPAALAFAVAAAAQTPPPPVPAGAKVNAQPYLDTAGQSDVFEITSSQIALRKSANPAVRRYATEMIRHHTMTTNDALAAAKAGGVLPPPPVLNAQYRAMISELNAAGAADFDRLYVGQQALSHRGALELTTGYARTGDNPALRNAARRTVPIVKRHLDEVEAMRARMM